MDWQLRWTKVEKERARARDLALFGVGISGECCGKDRLGRCELTGCLPDTKAAALLKFVMDLYEAEKSPREAFEGIDWETGKRREAGTASGAAEEG